MNVKVLRPSEMLSKEEIVNVKGGLNNGYVGDDLDCQCDCLWSNSNSQTNPKPTNPKPGTKPIKK